MPTNKEDTTKTKNVLIPEFIHRRLKIYAAKEGVTISAVVMVALSKYLDKEEKK